MSRSPVFFSGDVHLGAVPPETHRAFLSWLEYCGQEASRVILSGDLFDYWFEYRSVVPRGHTRVLGALAALVDAGIPVLLMGGNHDWWGGSFLTEELGIEFHQEPVVLDLHGRKTFLAHGDGLGSGDSAYQILRFVLRGSLTQFAFRWLHPDMGAWLARRASKTERRAGEPPEKQYARSESLKEWAEEKLRTEPDLDLVVLGHTHLPVLLEVESGRHYLNPGDWVIHKSYAVLPETGPPRIHDWREGPGSAGASSAAER
jgi:UDP-2,3-diacylglucosamine hydrolase